MKHLFLNRITKELDEKRNSAEEDLANYLYDEFFKMTEYELNKSTAHSRDISKYIIEAAVEIDNMIRDKYYDNSMYLEQKDLF